MAFGASRGGDSEPGSWWRVRRSGAEGCSSCGAGCGPFSSPEESEGRRWKQGCRNATQIHREIAAQGYPGAYQNVVRITRYLKEQELLGEPLPDASPGISAGQAAVPGESLDSIHQIFGRTRMSGHAEFTFCNQSIERTFSWIDQNRRMSKDYEKLCASGEAFVYAAMSCPMVSRLTRV